MNAGECQEIFRLLTTAFPPIHDYIDRIADWPATKAAWCKMLAGVRYEDAMTAVDRMMTGEAQAPQASWEIGNLPLYVRGVAGRVAQDRAKLEATEESRAMTQMKRGRSGSDNFRSVCWFWMAANNCYRKGLIDRNQLDDFWRDVVRFNQAPTVPIQVPPVLADQYRIVAAGKSGMATTQPSQDEINSRRDSFLNAV